MRQVRKILATSLITLILSGCGNTKTIKGPSGSITYDTYGLLNQNDKRNPDIEYEVIWGNVVLGCIFVETVIAPLYFFGFSLFEPIGPRPAVKGQVVGEVRGK